MNNSQPPTMTSIAVIQTEKPHAGPAEPFESLLAILILFLILLGWGTFCWIVDSALRRWRAGQSPVTNSIGGENAGHLESPVARSPLSHFLERVRPGNRLKTFVEWSRSCLSLNGIRIHLKNFSHRSRTTDRESNPADQSESRAASGSRGGGDSPTYRISKSIPDTLPPADASTAVDLEAQYPPLPNSTSINPHLPIIPPPALQ